jgi:hypothetical protein
MLVVKTVARIRREHFVKGKTIKENRLGRPVAYATVLAGASRPAMAAAAGGYRSPTA